MFKSVCKCLFIIILTDVLTLNFRCYISLFYFNHANEPTVGPPGFGVLQVGIREIV
jgi:hypothetical protein